MTITNTTAVHTLTSERRDDDDGPWFRPRCSCGWKAREWIDRVTATELGDDHLAANTSRLPKADVIRRGGGVMARDNKDPICDQMRAAREELGLSLQGAEEKTGIPTVVIGSYERGDRNPPLPQLRHWVEAFGRRLMVLEPGEWIVSTNRGGDERLAWLVVYGDGQELEFGADEARARDVARHIPGAKLGYRVIHRSGIVIGEPS